LVEKMFPEGWDHKYMSLVDRAVPTIKSVIEKGRGKGGYRSMGPDREEYGLACIGETPLFEDPISLKVKYMEAQCDGKTRAVTVMSSHAQILKPLHKLLYDQISSFPWLLRGKAKTGNFKRFKKVPGEVFVSGDYESATDHLPVTTAEWILRSIFRNCRYVPRSVQIAAIRYLRVEMLYPDGSEAKTTRQLMGSLLCFPLLCLQNYLAFRWVFGEDVPVKINGDDIVFRSSREKYEEWSRFVSSVGLRLSPGKTLVSTGFFSLNSTFFKVNGNRIRLVPVVRCCSLMKGKSPYPSSLSGSLRQFLEGFRGKIRDELGAWFLMRRASVIRKSGRSVVRGLGVNATDGMLKTAGLWKRELWYLNSVPDRYECFGSVTEGVPLPPPPDRLAGQVKLPSGWRRQVVSRSPSVRAIQLATEQEFWDEVTDLAWGTAYSPREVEQQYWADVESGSFESRYTEWRKMDFRSKKPFIQRFVAKITGVKGGRSRLKSRPFWFISGLARQRRTHVWCRVDEDTEEEPGEPLGDHFKEMVQRKIALVRAFETPFVTLCSERWLREEDALARYVQ
jgi:hypothetical protein